MKPKLIIFQVGKEPREIEIYGSVVTFGRSADNSVSFAGDSNVSRYHAQIEQRGAEFFVSDFGSSNGTTINGEKIKGEKLLKNDDKINFGGESAVQFVNPASEPGQIADEDSDNQPDLHTHSPQPTASGAPAKSSKTPIALAAAGVLSGAAIVSVAVVAAVLWSDSGCTPVAAILSPESGATVSETTEIKLNVKDSKCVERVTFLLDGEEIAQAETAPYSTTLELENFKQLADDDNSHVLTVAIVDRNGNRKLQTDEILLAFAEPEKGDKKPADEQPVEDLPADDQPTAPRDSSAQITIADTKTLAENLVKQFTGAPVYKYDQQFLREVQKKTADYKVAGFSRRANAYRDSINLAFVGEQGLDAPLGWVLAMSRSKFDNKKNQTSEGLWQMTQEFAENNGYNGQCGAETLSDSKQTCAARAAAIYSKALVVNLFQNDLIYGVACFGMSPSEAGQFQVALPPDRADFWNNIKSKPQRDQLVNFFAAGIVAQNPQKFGLKADQPLSNLYKNLIVVK